nr:immunoglobulin light chain junction region [Macaca mulatta]
CMQGLEFPSF